MRRTMTIAALIAAAGLLTACGGSDGGDKKEHADKAPAAASSKPGAKGQDKTYEVTLEVGGKSKTNVFYVAGSNGNEQVKLPWKKTEKVTLNSTERKVGITVHVVPGPVILPDGKAAAAPCSITVDGKQVDEDPGGPTGKHACKYTLH
ncbi:hypothetical protein ACGFSB_36880 [Streptomyces sp. NPDC048441]|uniref:hypothetical protein n=1 Tax=Streptomyces sp. NPDC048441 TaxID=3365552 RepID=UPI0037213D29